MGTTFSIDSLAQAIARSEGFNAGSVGTSANNPGNLELGDVGYGTVAAANGNNLTVFGSLQDGWKALTNVLNKDVSGQSSIYDPNESLDSFMNTYSGGNANAGSNVAGFLGVPGSTPISSFGGSIGANTSLPNAAPNAVQSSTTATTPFQDALNTASKALGLGGDGIFSIPSVMDIVVILAGLVLLAGAVFGFKSVSTTVVQGVKKGTAIAAA